jgi:xanthine dehydrogenase YagR molybdenum-binding subunit
MADAKQSVGTPQNRVDGRLKVTGAAKYAAEFPVKDVAYGVLVLSSIAKGTITRIQTAAAEKAPGVLAVITHQNAEKVWLPDKVKALVDPKVGRPLQPLQDDQVHYHGQPIGVVVADTFERAIYAATLVTATYDKSKAVLDFEEAVEKRFTPHEMEESDRGTEKSPHYERGEPEKALDKAEVKVEGTYSHPDEYHNPMELHNTIAVWEGKKLTLYDKTQWVDNVQQQVAAAFGIDDEDVRVISPFVGGAFGSALRTWAHVFIAALAAKQLKRPVKLVLTRAQQYLVPGYLPHTVQKVTLGASKDGRLSVIRHEATAKTSTYEEYTESTLNPTQFFYACPNVATRYYLAAVNNNTPASMRAPGEATGVFALDCALDELAHALKMDPLQLRLVNHADTDPEKELPWSSKSLKECYQRAAEKFGWANRNPEPRSMRDGRQLVGWGMASATWPTHRMKATVLVRILADGSAQVRTAASDIGPGTYTVMTQIAADALGLPAERVKFDLGDTRMPQAPVEGGSMTVASVGSAVHEAALAARKKVLGLASGDDQSPLHKADNDAVNAAEGRLFLKKEPGRGETYADILKRNKRDFIEVTQESKPGEEQKKFSMHAFGAQFVEVKVDPHFGTVRVTRVVSGLRCGANHQSKDRA